MMAISAYDVSIRRENQEDVLAIYEVNRTAFDREDEAQLVDILRKEFPDGLISLVAEVAGKVVGHILFSRMTVEDGERVYQAIGLGPMAVTPAYQGKGIGSKLVLEGMIACKAAGNEIVIVLGHPWFYPKFGFVPSSPYGIRWEHEAPDEVFMVFELVDGSLENVQGTARYLPPFEDV
jgi:putative acetyltransferase